MDFALLLAIAAFVAGVVYVILDGFDLGIGCVFHCFSFEKRGKLFDSIAPVWDGNETWIILALGVLLAAFPALYVKVLTDFYLYSMALLFFFALRGISFEFRLKAHKSKVVWDHMFFIGSCGATLVQGFLLANIMFIGVECTYKIFFAKTIIALILFATYVLLGAAWTIYKNDGEIKETAHKILKQCAAFLLLSLPIATYAVLKNHIDLQLFVTENTTRIALSSSSFIFCSAILLTLYAFSRKMKDGISYILSSLFVAVAVFGMASCCFPFIVPNGLTIWDVANAYGSLKMIFIMACVMLPIIIAYTGYVYFVFKGKLKPIDSFYSA